LRKSNAGILKIENFNYMNMFNFKSTKKVILALFSGIMIGGFAACSSDKSSGQSEKLSAKTEETVPDYGVGPVKSVSFSEDIDESLAERGKAVFESKCSACHKFDQRYVGPSLGGITERRNPAWIMNMIMNPQEMTQKDPIAKKLLAEYLTQMVFQDVTEVETRAMLEYFRKVDGN
jgi:mono/diheme cytochrome c family protein